MRLTEQQSKLLLADFGIPVSQATLVDSPAAAYRQAWVLAGPVVLKAQVPFGGRGKLGAVRVAGSPEQAREHAEDMLGMSLHHLIVDTLSVEPKLAFQSELYAGVAWDMRVKLPVALLGSTGGVDVEAGAADKIARRLIDPVKGLPAYEGREMAMSLGLTGKRMVQIGAVLSRLVDAFLQLDAVILEVNPLVERDEGGLLALDAHIEIDDDAAFRQRQRLKPLGDIADSSGARPPTPLELEAKRIDAMDHRGVAGRVVEFDGDMALLIGGGGASLTVFDAIKKYGGSPANYCELGGNPTKEKVAALTALLAAKPEVRSMSVIMNVVNNTRADVIAQGVLLGLEQAGRKPERFINVFRIPGSWEQEARALLAAHGIAALGREVSLDEAAKLSVQRAQQANVT